MAMTKWFLVLSVVCLLWTAIEGYNSKKGKDQGPPGLPRDDFGLSNFPLPPGAMPKPQAPSSEEPRGYRSRKSKTTVPPPPPPCPEWLEDFLWCIYQWFIFFIKELEKRFPHWADWRRTHMIRK